MTAAEPLDPETTEPAGRTDWTDDQRADVEEFEEFEPWNDEDWLRQDDDGSAEAGRWRRVRTIDVGEWL